jgi:hypothetical protein
VAHHEQLQCGIVHPVELARVVHAARLARREEKHVGGGGGARVPHGVRVHAQRRTARGGTRAEATTGQGMTLELGHKVKHKTINPVSIFKCPKPSNRLLTPYRLMAGLFV